MAKAHPPGEGRLALSFGTQKMQIPAPSGSEFEPKVRMCVGSADPALLPIHQLLRS